VGNGHGRWVEEGQRRLCSILPSKQITQAQELIPLSHACLKHKLHHHTQHRDQDTATIAMDVDTEELRLVYEAFSVRELKDELSSRGLRADGVSVHTSPPSLRPSVSPSLPSPVPSSLVLRDHLSVFLAFVCLADLTAQGDNPRKPTSLPPLPPSLPPSPTPPSFSSLTTLLHLLLLSLLRRPSKNAT